MPNSTFWVILKNSEDELLSDFRNISDSRNAHYASYRTYNELNKYEISSDIVAVVTKEIKKALKGSKVRALAIGDIIEVVIDEKEGEKLLQLSEIEVFKKFVEHTSKVNFNAKRTNPIVPDIPSEITPDIMRDAFYDSFEKKYKNAAPTLEESRSLGIKQAFYTDLTFGGFGLYDTALFLQEAFAYTQAEIKEFVQGKGALELTANAKIYKKWQENPNSEANLDIDMLLLLGQNIRTIQIEAAGIEEFFREVFSVAEINPNRTIYDLDMPQVITCSYGRDVQSLDSVILNRINREMMKLALMGITVITSAKDLSLTAVLSPELKEPYIDIYVNEKQMLVGGSSITAPVAAGVISTLNFWRRKYEKPFLGFINPSLKARGLGDLNFLGLVEAFIDLE